MSTAAEPVRRGMAPLLPHQLEVVSDRASKLRVMQGGYRSGKTVTGLAAVVDMGFRSDGAPMLVVEPTYRMIADVVVRAAQEHLTRWRIPWRYHRSDKILTVGRRRQFDVLCRSADQPRSMEGITVGGLWVDEWELCDVEALQVAMARVSIGPCQQIVLTGTPEGYGPAYDLILAKPQPGTRVFVVRTQQNTLLRASYVDDMRARLDDDTANEKLDGARRAKGGRVYSRFERERHTRVPCVPLGSGELQVWADFNVERMHWVIAEADAVGKRAHIVGEFVGRNTDTAKQAEDVKAWLAAYLTRTRRRTFTKADVVSMGVPVYCDASGTQRTSTTPLTNVVILQQAGLKPRHGARNPPIDDRVNTVQVMLRDRRLTVDADAAPGVVMTLERQAYVSGQPDKSNGLDAAADAIGYGCHWQFPVWRGPASVVEPEMQRDEWGVR